MSNPINLNSKALEAAAKVVNGLRHVTTGDSWDDSFEYFTRSAVAAYLDEAGTPMKHCVRHNERSLAGKVCHRGTATKPCVVVDAVLVLGGNDD